MRGDDMRRVNAALVQLPAEYREVLVLREMEELSYREIAAITDVPVGTVMSRLSRARRRLAMLLGSPRPVPAQAVGAQSAAATATGARGTPPAGTASEAIDGL